MKKNALIVGAGIGALATALRLTARGWQVEIVEKNAQPGGRLNQLKTNGFTFDTGPSFFSMSYEFEELASDAGFELPYKIIELDPLYSVNFAKQERNFLMHKNIAKLAEQFDGIEPDFENKMRRYLEMGKRLFHGTVDLAVRRNFDSLADYARSLMQAPPSLFPVLLRNFWQQVARYFSSNQAREIMSLVSFFLGHTPFDTPAVYALLSYTEFVHDGYYNVKGGMYKIVEGFVDELKKRGVKFHFNTEIVDFQEKNKRLDSLRDQNNQKWAADVFIINSDAALFRGKVFKRPEFSDQKLRKKNWTMGTLTFYLGIDKKLPGVNHHNYFLGKNYKEYAKKALSNPEIVQKPYYYVNVLSNTNPECAPEGNESLFFVCPVPDLRLKPSWDDKEKIVDSILADFSERTNTKIAPHIVSKTIYTPQDWGSQFNLYKGSALGLSHGLWQIGAFRPKNYDEKFENTFYVGASTVPGTGLPMAIIGSKLTTQRVEKYRAI